MWVKPVILYIHNSNPAELRGKIKTKVEQLNLPTNSGLVNCTHADEKNMFFILICAFDSYFVANVVSGAVK